MDSKPSQKVYYGWIVVAVSFVTMAIVSPAWFSFSLFYPPILTEFGWTRAATASVYSLNLFVSGALSPLIGLLIDRYGPRTVMPIGALLLAAGFVGSSQIHQLWHFYLWFGLVGAVGLCAVQVVPHAAIISNWFGRNRATALGIIMASLGLGRLVFFPAIQYVISRSGWRVAYIWLAAIITVIVVPIIILFQRHKPADKGLENHPEVSSGAGTGSHGARGRQMVVVDRQWAGTEWTLKNAARTYRFWALALLFIVATGATFLIGVQLVAYLQSAGISSITAASFVGLQGLMSTAGNFVGGILSDRVGREKTLTLSAIIYIAGILALSLIQVYPTTILLYGYAVFFGVGFGMSFPAIMASAADVFQGKRFGSIFGAMNMLGGFGGAFGAWLGGYAFDKTGGYRAMFIIATAVVASSIVLVWSARPSKVRTFKSGHEQPEENAGWTDPVVLVETEREA
ncbi:MAG TPA: MFS transporter [Blastocatellia bacterium]|nr:MFS transporter [Blastocatellia bacterium]